MSKPRAYIEGSSNFYGFDFKVDSSTLIPRPETEQLVERTVELINKYGFKKMRIADIGTGSGVIAITLKKLVPENEIVATDISSEAIKIASRNAETNKVEIDFRKGSLFSPIDGRFDLIIANLPYVPAARWRFLESQVRDYEPKTAIIAGRDGLNIIKLFIKDVAKFLNPKSIIALEIDDTHGPRVEKLLKQALPNHDVYIEKDLAGYTRFAFAKPKNYL